MKTISALLLLATILLSGCAAKVHLSTDNLSISPRTVTGNKLPIRVGLFIDEETRTFKETIRPEGLVLRSAFPVGKELSKLLLRVGQACFEKVGVVDSVFESRAEDFDAYLIVRKLNADIQASFTNQEAGAFLGIAGALLDPPHAKTDASFSVSVTVVDSNSNDIYSANIVGKGSSDVRSQDFSPGVNNALQDLARNLMTELLTSQQIKDYANSIKK